MSNVCSLRRDLREFVLENVQVFGEERVLGTGSYGSVQEVEVNGEVYAAKMIHEVLLETDKRGGVESVATKYLRECQLMSRMRHPNITQFIGVCFPPGSRLPLLVMERLECSLDDLIETTPTLPLSVSVYMLTGVCRGLLHLHRESVVHRDLTARNVLLTASLRAKITDFGNSRIVQMEPGQLARALTRLPGTLTYMPPEAVSEHVQYGPSLDVFSFGVLTLFVLIQVFPSDLLPPNYPDPDSPDRLLGRSEFERRSKYTSHLKKKLDPTEQQEHRLFGMVRECLANEPGRRPTTSNLLSLLEEVGTEMAGDLLQLDIGKVKAVRTLRAKDFRIQQLQEEMRKKNNLLAEKDTQIGEKDLRLTELTERHNQLIRQQQTDLAAKDDIITTMNQEVTDRNIQLAQNNQQLIQKDGLLADQQATIADQQATILAERERALAEKEALIQAHREQIELKDAELARRAALIQRLEDSRGDVIKKDGSPASLRGGTVRFSDPPESTSPLILKWRRGKDMPIKMGVKVNSVVIGDTVYVGGGDAGSDCDRCTVMKLDLQRDEWTKLPLYSAKWFAMTSLDNQLVLVGGWNSKTKKPTNQIGVFVSEEWTRPFPPMNISRQSSIAVSFNSYIIVAGGHTTGQRRISSVEVLDVAAKRWYIAESLPNARTSLKSALLGSTLYLMGGWDHTGSLAEVVHKADLNELITKAVSQQTSPTLWQTIDNTPFNFSAPLGCEGLLFAVGGQDDSADPSSSIYIYQSDTRRWVKVGDLPTAQFNCTCSVLPSGEVIVAGGQTGASSFINTVDFIRVLIHLYC